MATSNGTTVSGTVGGGGFFSVFRDILGSAEGLYNSTRPIWDRGSEPAQGQQTAPTYQAPVTTVVRQESTSPVTGFQPSPILIGAGILAVILLVK